MNFSGKKAEIQQFIYKLDKDVVYDIKVEKHKEKRSLDQNAKAWALINEIANVLRVSKEEIYESMLRAYGQRDYILLEDSVNPDYYFKYYDKETTLEKNGKRFSSYLIYRGSSEFDTREMSIFIDGIIQEAKQLDIDVEKYN